MKQVGFTFRISTALENNLSEDKLKEFMQDKFNIAERVYKRKHPNAEFVGDWQLVAKIHPQMKTPDGEPWGEDEHQWEYVYNRNTK